MRADPLRSAPQGITILDQIFAPTIFGCKNVASEMRVPEEVVDVARALYLARVWPDLRDERMEALGTTAERLAVYTLALQA